MKINLHRIKLFLSGVTSSMVKENLPSLQKKALEIFGYFEEFCKEHKLLYFVCGGGCIGAIRHQGFIPWDDDLDVFMPRPDYEKFTKLWETYGDHKNYTLCRTNEEVNYHDCGTLLKDNHTTFINSHSVNEDFHHGYMIDIIPLDGCAPTKTSRMIQMFWASVYSLYNAQRVPNNQGTLMKTLAPVLLFLVPSNKLKYKLWNYAQKKMSKYDFYNSEYITELVTGYKYMSLKYPKKVFEEQLFVPFETTEIPIPVDYETYLSMAFGNYMKMPPEDERNPKHKVVFLDLNTSYKEYKGIWYCKNDK